VWAALILHRGDTIPGVICLRGKENEVGEWSVTGRADDARRGCGPLIAPLSESMRPLRQQVFERVRAAGLMPRVQVAKELGVSPASVTTITSELIDLGLLEEVTVPREGTETGRGRPPVALGVRRGASGRRHEAFGPRAYGGRRRLRGQRPGQRGDTAHPTPSDPAALLAASETLLDRVTAAAGVTRSAISALGIGVPGFVDSASGHVFWSSVLNVRSFDLARAASERLGVPGGHRQRREPRGARRTLVRGRARNGRFRRRHHRARARHGPRRQPQALPGRAGGGDGTRHTKVQLDGALCRCGQRGCLEAYVADYALAREATTALNWIHKDGQPVQVLLESLYDHAKAGNPAARSIFRRAGRYLAVGLANVVNLFDPALIILSGERMRYDYLYAADSLAEMESLVLNTGRRPPPIEVHAWGDMLWAQGAAALALSVVTETTLAVQREVAAQ
jgi:predicted NBD/HSP70 family sugar kinase